MVFVCAVRTCVNGKVKSRNKDCKLHKFSNDIILVQKWLKNCNRLDLCKKSLEHLLTSVRVCSKHFTTKMFSSPENSRLLPTAVPTLFESTESSYNGLVLYSVPLPCDLVVDNGFLQKQEILKQNENIMKNNEEIKNKLEMIRGMHSRANMNEEDQIYMITQCDNILTMLGKNTDFKKTSNLELTRKKKLNRKQDLFKKKKVTNQHLSTLSSIEDTQIRESLKNSTEFLTISTTPAFDHSYL